MLRIPILSWTRSIAKNLQNQPASRFTQICHVSAPLISKRGKINNFEELKEPIFQQTKSWIKEIVIGLKLCPFAKDPFENDSIHYKLSSAITIPEAHDTLFREINYLIRSHKATTAMFIVPFVLDFEDFVTFQKFINLESLLLQREVEDIPDIDFSQMIQLGCFHSKYVHADSKGNEDAANYSSRSPYPTIQIIRHKDLAEERKKYGKKYLLSIPKLNKKILTNIGIEKIESMYESILKGNRS